MIVGGLLSTLLHPTDDVKQEGATILKQLKMAKPLQDRNENIK